MPGFHVVTFGCQMNSHDSERMGEVLRRAGYTEAAGTEDADVILLNTCSVREKAEQKLRSEVGRLAVLKRRRPGLVLAVTGCVAQQEGERLLRGMPEVDLIVGPDNIADLPRLLADVDQGGPPQVRTVFDLDEPRFLAAEARPGATGPSAYVTVMKGCNERCSFCIVPTTRGPERYRSSHEILDEIERLVAAGVREVTLLGQTVNSYCDPARALPEAPLAGEGVRRWGTRAAADETEFPALLRAIASRVPGLARLRYTSPHPRHLTPALAATHADLGVLARHVHMPVQSGSERMLKRMIRRYSIEEYVERLGLVREAVPGVTFSTDVIVGFPGETREDFEQTLALVGRVGFVGVYGFKYSVRPYTPAQKLGDDVPEAEKATRLAELFAAADVQQQRHLNALVGTRATVLVEGPSKGGKFTGRTERNDIVHVPVAGDPTGELLDVVVRRAHRRSLAAEPVEPSRRVDPALLAAMVAAPAPAPVATERRSLPVV